MSALLPKRPTGNSSEAKYHQRIWDALNTIVSRFSPRMKTSVTTRGVFQEPMARGGGVTAAPASFDVPEWSSDESYDEGDKVVRSQGIKGPGPWTPSDAISTGRQTGMWEATEDIQEGTDPDGPSLDNTKWRCVAPHATEQFVLSKDGKGLIQIDVGRDGDARPKILISDADVAQGGQGGLINLSAGATEGRRMEPMWAEFCVKMSDGTKRTMRAKVLMSEPEEIPPEDQ